MHGMPARSPDSGAGSRCRGVGAVARVTGVCPPSCTIRTSATAGGGGVGCDDGGSGGLKHTFHGRVHLLLRVQRPVCWTGGTPLIGAHSDTSIVGAHLSPATVHPVRPFARLVHKMQYVLLLHAYTILQMGMAAVEAGSGVLIKYGGLGVGCRVWLRGGRCMPRASSDICLSVSVFLVLSHQRPSSRSRSISPP